MDFLGLRGFVETAVLQDRRSDGLRLILTRTNLASQYPKERLEERIKRLVKNVSISIVARDSGKIVEVLFDLTDI